MPLEKSGSKAAVGHNVSKMVSEGYPQKVAVAAALNNQRRYGGGKVGVKKSGYKVGVRKK